MRMRQLVVAGLVVLLVATVACAPVGTVTPAVEGTCEPTQEICDGKDNDCDDTIDEDLTQSCYTGPPGTEGIGICKAGAQGCTSGEWGPCRGEVTPSSEICDDNLDNDCDGMIDSQGFRLLSPTVR